MNNNAAIIVSAQTPIPAKNHSQIKDAKTSRKYRTEQKCFKRTSEHSTTNTNLMYLRELIAFGDMRVTSSKPDQSKNS
ncbi:unnamed protein product [Ceratitis capitata]|uniref:(Mediterranean fruit fly) hypothetical protein n=1 Tax=Ceratitis capitata TaxID=7213 RepID=A0A811U035_CERCA|nr:unnamed protein product [Ceratitis capitata]